MGSMRIFLPLLMISLASAGSEVDQQRPKYRLPGDVIPLYYDLRILTNLADLNSNFTFSGDVAIKIKSVSSTNKIVLHSRGLTINEEKVRVLGGVSKEAPNPCRGESNELQNIKISRQSYDDDLDYYEIFTDSALDKDKFFYICIPFESLLSRVLSGFYRSSYKDQLTGETRWLAVTQFEATDARKAFPCFDEPDMKATFEVTIGHHNSKTALSNMPIVKTEPIKGMDGWSWDHFDVTVPMSTYLLAFMVSDFVSVESPSVKSNDVAFRVWARKDAESQVKFAAEIGPKVLEDYEKYFSVRYPLPKQDMVAVPDFHSGAMENWGLITYRETALLFDPKYTSASSKPYVASVIAHELAHQWFGNLVTMKWWTDLWLNEGFATYVATQETDKLYPEWKFADDSLVSNFMTVLNIDSLKSSHPISVPVQHPREIAQIFDKISYKKGSFILHMMNKFLGEKTFREGVSKYLKLHAFKNAEQDDLWTSLTQEAHANQVLPANLTVKQIMDTWTLQTGYPLLTVTRDYKKGTATVSQRRYLADTTVEAKSDDTTWWAPLTYTTASQLDFNNSSPRKWIAAGEKETSINGIPEEDWLLFNIQLAGLYRINYDSENWNRLQKALNSDNYGNISVLNRVQLIDDAFDLARSGIIDYSVPLGILQYLPRETEFQPWKAAVSGLSQLDRLLHDHDLYGAFRGYVKSLVTPIYNLTSQQELDDTPSNLQKIKLQRMASSWACKLSIADCRSKAVHLFRQWMSTTNPDETNPVPKNMRDTIYCYAIKEGGEEEWNFAWRRYLKSNVGAHKNELLGALGCTRETWLLNRYLRWAIDESSGIKRQDSRVIFYSVSRNDLGYFLAKAFFTNNIKDYYKIHGSKTADLSPYFSSLASHVTSLTELEEYLAFRAKNEEYLKGGKQGIDQVIESARINVDWYNKFYSGVAKYLADPAENVIS